MNLSEKGTKTTPNTYSQKFESLRFSNEINKIMYDDRDRFQFRKVFPIKLEAENHYRINGL